MPSAAGVKMERTLWFAALVVCLAPIACSRAPPEPAESLAAPAWAPAPVERSHLPNVYKLHEQVLSGGQPHGEAGYRELAGLGIKTVISVDGAQPDVELAAKYGLRYVHLPHGYDGVPEERAQMLAKAVLELPGPIYIHCHHGKHRSPAAAAVACVGAGLVESEHAITVLRTAGTSESYRGLYESAEKARRFDSALLKALAGEFPERAAVPPLAEAMVRIEHTHDHLKAIEKNGWRPLPAHPDLDPPHEALLLREGFTELLRTGEVKRQPAEFQAMLRRSEAASAELEAGLRTWTDPRQPPPENVAGAFARITNDCKACHQKFRDLPLSEKQGTGQ
jgi:protein tyrosine phosphatase (PTP) superfamily phosphohydrolase (DUF442 family)